MTAGDRGLGSVGIVGCGQIGTAIGMALARRGAASEIVLHDRDPGVLARSHARGAGTVPSARIEDALLSETVVLALPVSGIVDVLARHGGTIRDGALVIDTGSAKLVVVQAMRRTLPPGVLAVGGHPIAGTERPGPDGADPDALAGATFALCPVRDDGAALERAERFVAALGSRASVVDAAAHDRAVARTIGLPHLLAFALAAVSRVAGAQTLSGTGLRGATRLAASDPLMVASLLAANARETRAALAELRAALDALAARLDDEPALARALGESAA